METGDQFKFGDVADMMYQLLFNIFVATGGFPDELEHINNFVLEYAKEKEEK